MEKLELRRQVFHLVFGIAIVVLLYYGLIRLFHLIALLVTGTVIALIATRWRIPIVAWGLDTFERKDVTFPGQGAIFYMIGSILSVILFEERIAYASILILAVGDSIGPVIGKTYGRMRSPLNRRYIEGVLAGIVTASLSVWIFVPLLHAFVASAASLLVEALELKFFHKIMDDNIYIPLIAGTVLTLMQGSFP
jgi:dolichol kinase